MADMETTGEVVKPLSVDDVQEETARGRDLRDRPGIWATVPQVRRYRSEVRTRSLEDPMSRWTKDIPGEVDRTS